MHDMFMYINFRCITPPPFIRIQFTLCGRLFYSFSLIFKSNSLKWNTNTESHNTQYSYSIRFDFILLACSTRTDVLVVVAAATTAGDGGVCYKIQIDMIIEFDVEMIFLSCIYDFKWLFSSFFLLNCGQLSVLLFSSVLECFKIIFSTICFHLCCFYVHCHVFHVHNRCVSTLNVCHQFFFWSEKINIQTK